MKFVKGNVPHNKGIEQPLEEIHGTYNAYNHRKCRCDECMEWMRIRDRKQREKRYMMLAQIKLESGCVDCGYNEYACALDFDHVDGVKEFTMNRVGRIAWSRVMAEIAKCEVVCAVCHRVRTQTRNGGFLITMDDIKKWMEGSDG